MCRHPFFVSELAVETVTRTTRRSASGCLNPERPPKNGETCHERKITGDTDVMNDRWIGLAATCRIVRFDSSNEVLRYKGVTVTRYQHGIIVTEEWVPHGANPSATDDDRLIGVVRAAEEWAARGVLPQPARRGKLRKGDPKRHAAD